MNIDRLIDDEKEAIRAYDEAITEETVPGVIELYRRIIDDEKEHIRELERVKSGEYSAMSLFGMEE